MASTNAGTSTPTGGGDNLSGKLNFSDEFKTMKAPLNKLEKSMDTIAEEPERPQGVPETKDTNKSSSRKSDNNGKTAKRHIEGKPRDNVSIRFLTKYGIRITGPTITATAMDVTNGAVIEEEAKEGITTKITKATPREAPDTLKLANEE
ncbi:hypothetical protein AbraIFM66951_001617 [Aspergillus brasiliensis]|uniref:Uncharacterized protein n=1 Tax=Aspergillus brasiliensis TaxID=319629 RepID=A0A9W5YM95_9EURO|nr:hypothetical protein AbraCBS73388_005201 [Aspergillus brasiliensis]GKZ49213.1 hypothetical protein AbraIFM66951_001617 [Aspergillus brasiliensis]